MTEVYHQCCCSRMFVNPPLLPFTQYSVQVCDILYIGILSTGIDMSAYK